MNAFRMRRIRANALRETEVFILSFPKSGRTWLAVLVGKALSLQYDYPGELIPHTVELTKRIKAERDPRVKVTGFGHDRSSLDHRLDFRAMFVGKSEFSDKDVIFLVRDPKDVVVSYYFQATKRNEVFSGSLSDFVRDEELGIRKILAFNKNWYENRQVPRRFELFTYEQMHEDPRRVLRATLEIMGAENLPDDMIAQAVEYSGFENMRELERRNALDAAALQPANANDPESFKVRKGVVGGYRDYLSDDDIAYIDAQLAEMRYPL